MKWHIEQWNRITRYLQARSSSPPPWITDDTSHKRHRILEIKQVIFHRHKCDHWPSSSPNPLSPFASEYCECVFVCVGMSSTHNQDSQYYDMVARSANELWLEPGVQMNDILHHFWHSCFVAEHFCFHSGTSTAHNAEFVLSGNDRMCLEQKASGHSHDVSLAYLSIVRTSNSIRPIHDSCDISFNRTRNVEEKQ